MSGAPTREAGRGPIPARAGVGLRAPHYKEILDRHPPVAWFEVHSENVFCAGGFPLHDVERIRADYPLSFHGVGLSLGSADPLDARHLARLRERVRRLEPGLVSEHLSWSSVDGRYLHDLLPLPCTRAAVIHVADRIRRVRDYLGREILIENVSSYLEYTQSEFPEWEFLVEVLERADCGALLDVNNLYVNAVNHGFDPLAYLEAIPLARVREIHLAGHSRERIAGRELLIDTHSRPVAEPVWDLYHRAIERFGPVPVLIEWDADIPPIETLLGEARRADRLLEPSRAVSA